MTGAITMPAPNQAISAPANSATVTGNSSVDQPPAAMKPAPGNHRPSPNVCQAGAAPNSDGSSPSAQTAA